MAGKSNLTHSDYVAIVDAFREAGPNVAQLARMTGRRRETITKALRQGWPEFGWPALKPDRPAMSFVPGGVGTSSASSASAPSSGTGSGTAGGSDGLSSKQVSARSKEQDAILAGVQNLVGSSIATTQILQKLIEQAPNILSKIGGTGEDAISPREYVRLIRELSKVNRESSDALNRLMAAGRLNTGEAQSIAETRHTGNVGISVEVTPEAAADRQRRLEHLLDIHARRRAYVPDEYVGEEAGMIDVEATPTGEVNLGDLAKPTALTAIREAAPAAKVAGQSHAEAEQRLRLALQARGMPATQIDRLVDKAKARAEQVARELSGIVDEILAAPPGQAN